MLLVRAGLMSRLAMLSSDYSSQPSVSVSQLPPQAGLVGGGSSGAGGGGTAHPTWGAEKYLLCQVGSYKLSFIVLY